MGMSGGVLAPWAEPSGSKVPRFPVELRAEGHGSPGGAWGGGKHSESQERFGCKYPTAGT